MIDSLAAPSTAQTARPTETARKSVASDYDTFLKMLTTQMQNQDPLNPIDSADYAVQLATFSGVEQQTRTNQLIEQLLNRFSLTGLADLAGSVGQEALSSGPVWFDGTTPPELSARLATGADRGVLVVRNAAGNVVAREDVAADAIAWSGRTVTGQLAAPGRYSLSLESLAGETPLGTSPVASYATVQEVRREGSGIALVLRGGVVLPADELLALRAP